MKIGIVGGGVAGLGAAWLLSRRHDVRLFEAGGSLGGHANTVDISVDGQRVPVDTGFIVYNEPNYPNLTHLFEALRVETAASDMSFSVSLDDGAFEYAGTPLGLLAQPFNALRPDFWRLIRDLVRFYRDAPDLTRRADLDRLTLGELLSAGGYSDLLANRHLLPMAAAIWSSTFEDIRAFPARTFLQFFENHGLLRLSERPQWRTVMGGSRRYVDALSARFRLRTHLGTPIFGAYRTPNGVTLRDGTGGVHRFDHVVFATHADQALAILGNAASRDEARILSAFRYQKNRAVLHRDRALMPKRRRVWSSWNYLARSDGGGAAVSYWMNRLQPLSTDQDIFVTLNPERDPASHLTHESFVYDHPQFDHAALDAQEMLPMIQGRDRIWYCGSYCGYGFHEDGLQAGMTVAAALGAPAPWSAEIVPMSPAWRVAAPASFAAAAE